MVGHALYICALFLIISTRIIAEEGGSKFSDSFADLVLTGGIVATVDQEMSIVEAIAIRGSRIIAVGPTSEISRFVGPTTAAIDLEGKFVMPGFIEGHGHFMSLGRSLQILDLSEAEDWDEIVSRTALAVDSLEPGQWLYGRGWHQDKWKNLPGKIVDGVPTNERLNEVAPENPIIFGHASGHASFVNDYALELAGINASTLDPAGGEIVLFDRSWYNRAGVERVMGFATEKEVEEFFRDVVEFERMLVRSGIILLKYWFSISDEEQQYVDLSLIHI